MGVVDTLHVFVDSGEAWQQAPVTDVLYRGQGEPIKVSESRRLGPGRLVERCVLSVAGPRASLALPLRGCSRATLEDTWT